MFAGAPGDDFGFGDRHLFRLESGAFMRAVAEELALGAAARAPPVLAGFDFLDDGTALVNNGIGHN